MTCGKLLVSWVLVGVGVFLVAHFEQVGVLMAIVPMGIAQSMRLENDRAMYAYFRENRFWLGLTVTYYFVLLVVAVVAAVQGIHLINLPLVIFIVMIMGPYLFIMLYGDMKNCSGVSFPASKRRGENK
jgi:uncharacterized membrane protein YhdT